MSRMTKEKELELISNNAEKFEIILSNLEKIDESRLEALISVREKLKFNSDNPKLIIKNSCTKSCCHWFPINDIGLLALQERRNRSCIASRFNWNVLLYSFCNKIKCSSRILPVTTSDFLLPYYGLRLAIFTKLFCRSKISQ